MSAIKPDTDVTLIATRVIKATPERVFRAWTTPEEMKQWMAPGPMRVGSVTADLRVGGRYRVVMVDPAGVERIVSGEYQEVTPPTRLVYTWKWETSVNFPDSVVMIDFVATAAGTEIRMAHCGLPDDNSREQHQKGWTGCVDKLEKLFA